MRFEKKTFKDFRSKGKAEFDDIEFVKCHFVNCYLGERGASKRPVIRNVRLLNCSQDRCLLVAPILQDILVDGLNTKGQMPEIRGAALSQVTLRGKIDRLWIRPSVIEPSMQGEIDKANAKFYKDVEWALDIRQIDCKELDIKGIPVELIRRDPETQGVVTHEKAMEDRWKELKFRCGLSRVVLEEATETDSGALLIACKRDPNVKELLADLKMLRKEGIAEPD